MYIYIKKPDFSEAKKLTQCQTPGRKEGSMKASSRPLPPVPLHHALLAGEAIQTPKEETQHWNELLLPVNMLIKAFKQE